MGQKIEKRVGVDPAGSVTFVHFQQWSFLLAKAPGSRRNSCHETIYEDAQIGQKVNYIMLLTLTFLKNTLDFLQAELRLGEGKKKASGSSCDKLPCVKPPVHIITVPDIIGS